MSCEEWRYPNQNEGIPSTYWLLNICSYEHQTGYCKSTGCGESVRIESKWNPLDSSEKHLTLFEGNIRCFDGNQNSEIKLSGFVDADWGGDAETRRSNTGCLSTVWRASQLGQQQIKQLLHCLLQRQSTLRHRLLLTNCYGSRSCLKNLVSGRNPQHSYTKTTWVQS